jgi:hypothetical protein
MIKWANENILDFGCDGAPKEEQQENGRKERLVKKWEKMQRRFQTRLQCEWNFAFCIENKCFCVFFKLIFIVDRTSFQAREFNWRTNKSRGFDFSFISASAGLIKVARVLF